MSPKSQRTPRAHRVQPCRTAGVPPGADLISHGGDGPMAPPSKSNSSGGTWSSVVSGGRTSLRCSALEMAVVCGLENEVKGPVPDSAFHIHFYKVINGLYVQLSPT